MYVDRERRFAKGKSEGNLMDFLAVGLSVLVIAIMVTAAMQSLSLMIKKLEISQIARKYILIMETEGGLESADKDQLCRELESTGMTGIDLSGTTMLPDANVEYGDTIQLHIRGNVSGMVIGERSIWQDGFEERSFYVEEKRVSTAKH